MEPNKLRDQRRGGGAMVGIVFLIGGALLLAYKMGAGIPGWLFEWPMILIVFGLITLIKHRFRNFGGYILILIGGLFIADKYVADMNIKNYIAPIAIMSVGLLLIFRPKHMRRRDEWRGRFKEQWKEEWKEEWKNKWRNESPSDVINSGDGEYLDSTSIFGSTKKVILSKNFKGGDITCFMGGSEIDLTKADIQERVIIDVTMVFGGTKLTVPSNWDVKSEMAAIFGGIEDKRQFVSSEINTEKILIIKGTCIFGGIEINSY
jgi:predicted membrane protein